MFWLVYEVDGQRQAIIQPSPSLVSARMSVAIRKLIEGKFIEGHKLEAKHVKKLPKDIAGKPLSARQAQTLLKKIG